MQTSFGCLTAIALVAALAGCGGGGDDVISLRVAAAPGRVRGPAGSVAQPVLVTLVGCVVDDFFQPRSDTPLRAQASDGRLLGNAQSDARGAFRMQLPLGQTVTLAIDRPDGEVMKVATGPQGRALTTCLVDPSA